MEPTANESSIFDLSINETAKDHLRKTANWAMIIVICAVVGYVFTIVKALQPRSVFQESEGFGSSITEAGNITGAIIEIVIGLVINYFLFQFANLTRKGINGMSQPDLNAGFNNLKVYFIIVGVLVILFLVIVVLAVIGFSASGTRY